ncbi:MAG: polyprenyl synthetase family protein, partial [Alphaproteobacteria bacterium]|nr:polyprenyl synthetase family protein [Alphaproteobacteria bacterium]
MSILSLDRAHEVVEKDLASVDKLIFNTLSEHDKSIEVIGNYVISAGGKRIRPLLNLIFANVFGYQGDGHIKIGAAIEFFHTATLLHDDVIDESNIRRGKEAVHKKWTNKYAILVGDFLFSQAFRLMIATNSIEVLNILSKAAAIISEGEVKQLNNLRNIELDQSEYIDVIQSKTAELFAVACETAAVISKQNKDLQQASYEFGINMGISFQIMDDILDYTSDNLGKELGKDYEEGKVTLPIILLNKVCDLGEREFIKRLFKNGEKNEGDFELLVKCIEKYDIFNESKKIALFYSNKAEKLFDANFKSLDKQEVLRSI